MEPTVLRYDDRGAGEPIVLVPGALTGWLSWIPHQERLAERFRVVRLQPIHNELGSAGRPGVAGYTAETEREALRLTLDALDLERPHLAGWSGGARALLEFAAEYPDRVASLALVEPPASWVLRELGEPSEEAERADALVRRLFGRPVDEGDLAAFLVVAGFADSEAAARAHPGWDRWLEHRTALSWQGALIAHPGRSVDDLHRISVPVVLFRGSTTAGWLRRVVDVLAERLPNASVVELEGSHASHVESIDGFLAAFEAHVAAAGVV